MGIVLDILIVAILILSVFLGYRRGLAASAIKLCAFLIALIVTVLLYRPIGNFIINATSIDESIQNSIYDKVTNDIGENKENEDQITSNLIESAKEGMLETASRELTINIIYGATIIILFLIIRIALIVISKIADLLAKLPIIKQINGIGGAIYGILRGIVIIYAILIIIGFVSQIYPGNIVIQSINQSTLGQIMYENNIFNIFFK